MINGERVGVHVLERDAQGRWCATPEQLASWRLVVPVKSDCIALAVLAGATLREETRAGRLVLEVAAAAFERSAVGLERAPGPKPQGGTGGYLAYDVTALRGRARGDSFQDLAGAFSLNGFAGEWSMQHDMAARDGDGLRRGTRLDTSVRREDPARMASLVLGDAIGATSVLGAPVRFGGISYGTNFALRPEFVPYPLPSLRGGSALPTAADLLVNGERRASFPLQPGPFEVQGLPLVTGSGEAQLTTRDVLGRQQVITVPFYVAPSLLAPGLDEYRIDAGWLRESFGERSADYTDPFAAAQWRRGLSPTWSAEARGELMRGRAGASVGSQWLVGGLGLATLGAGLSRGGDGTGHGAVAAFERQGGNLSFGLRAQWASPRFAMVSGGSRPPAARLVVANAGWSFGRWGGVGVAVVQERPRDADALETRTASYNVSITRDVAFVLTAGRTRTMGRDDPYAAASLMVNLGESRTAGLNLARNNGATSRSLQAQSAIPTGEGWMWRVLATDYLGRRLDAGVSWQGARSTLGLEAGGGAHDSSVRASASGTVLVLDRNIFFARSLGESFAVAEVPGVAGVRIYSENQEVARTDARGYAVIPRLNPYTRQTLRLDTADIPLESDLKVPTLEVVPFGRNGTLARFPLRRQRSALARLTLEDGEPVPAGAIATVGAREVPVGRDGVTFIPDRPGDSRISVRWEGLRCGARLPEIWPQGELPELDDVTCFQETGP